MTIELGANEETENGRSGADMKKERSVANTENERRVVDGGKSAGNPAQCAIS